jgi:hypothetical protein
MHALQTAQPATTTTVVQERGQQLVCQAALALQGWCLQWRQAHALLPRGMCAGKAPGRHRQLAPHSACTPRRHSGGTHSRHQPQDAQRCGRVQCTAYTYTTGTPHYWARLADQATRWQSRKWEGLGGPLHTPPARSRKPRCQTLAPLDRDDIVLSTQWPTAHLLLAQQLAALSSPKRLQLRDSL